MCPARATVLWDVLIQGASQVRDTILVTPRESLWQIITTEICVRKRARELSLGNRTLKGYFASVTVGHSGSYCEGSQGELHFMVGILKKKKISN